MQGVMYFIRSVNFLVALKKLEIEIKMTQMFIFRRTKLTCDNIFQR